MASGELYGGGDCKKCPCRSGGFVSPVAFDNDLVANTGEYEGSGSGLFVCGEDVPERGYGDFVVFAPPLGQSRDLG